MHYFAIPGQRCQQVAQAFGVAAEPRFDHLAGAAAARRDVGGVHRGSQRDGAAVGNRDLLLDVRGARSVSRDTASARRRTGGESND